MPKQPPKKKNKADTIVVPNTISDMWHNAYIKVQKDKKKADSAISAFKVKSDSQKANAVKKVQSDNPLSKLKSYPSFATKYASKSKKK